MAGNSASLVVVSSSRAKRTLAAKVPEPAAKNEWAKPLCYIGTSPGIPQTIANPVPVALRS